jgi:formylglycine-generating enzyme required for sulfatase activity
MKTLLLLSFLFFSIIVVAQRPEMVEVKGGTFLMGGFGSDNLDEKPEHQVAVSSFTMSKYEVTFDDFDLFCSATGYKSPKDGKYGRGQLPVINVSWHGAIFYCNWMSSRFNLDKVYNLKVDSMGIHILDVDWDANGYRLPTEAEWEYVARGGKSGGLTGELTDYVWYEDNSEGKPHDVGTLKPNSLGIFDIRGNAWEWCWDLYDATYYSKSEKDNPHGAEKGDKHVYRGGNFNSTYDFTNVSKRFSLRPTINDGLIGIRLVQKVQ